MNNPFVKPSPLSISRARKVMKTLEWRGVETPVALLSELTGFSEAQIRGVLANTDKLNEYLDLPIVVSKRVSRNGHNYYMATVGNRSPSAPEGHALPRIDNYTPKGEVGPEVHSYSAGHPNHY